MNRYLFALTLPLLTTCSVAAETSRVANALTSITSAEMKTHVSALADDTFEGREAGSRGGRAAGLYLVQQLQKYGLRGGVKGGYYQPFGSYTNIIGVLEGSDPVLKDQYIVVGAHYDHVGYGTRRNSYGPVGYIHNGADDNASGVSTLLEVAQAFAASGVNPRRTILFCFWDAEEKGLFGSQHWVDHPTVPLKNVVLAFNIDMIGRLGKNKLEVLGIRTAPGLRRLVATANDDPALFLSYNWELKENSDHHSFLQKKIPVVMFHTGLHGDYHRPSDDAEKIDTVGMQTAARLLFRFLDQAADQPEIGKFRSQARLEGPWAQRVLDRGLPPVPGRLGLSWDEKQATEGKLLVTALRLGSPAEKAGIKTGDRIVEFAGQPIDSATTFRAAVLGADNPVEVTLERAGEAEPVKMEVQLDGSPVRLGISWRTDEAEPGTLIVSRVIPGSAADLAGVKLNDRIYTAAGSPIPSSEAFQQLVSQSMGPLELAVENSGQIRNLMVILPSVE